ncbi:hypothetical protein ANCDUO_08271 [Ancylostoma duodenale]|uniref:BHLH domain-containing protein n=1 Tax=Ancylostoma duodenale TaxID=51022 RepID=A0A0C2CWW4_9BILA|nr:hypothetical protein ANCDUO_08271 [Ancylostoma duodenale]
MTTSSSLLLSIVLGFLVLPGPRVHRVESTLRRLVGSEEGASQLELVLSAIRYIRELQSQLENDKENDLPDALQDLFTQCSVSKAATA